MNNERDCKHGQLARSCEICGLEAENAALKAELAARWLPIESAPKDGAEILLSNGETISQGHWLHVEPYIREIRDADGRYIDQDENEGYDGWIDYVGGMLPGPTYYMPLPAAPGASPQPSQARELQPHELSEEELNALLRFVETCEDGEGYDVPKTMMKKLGHIGVVNHISGGVYSITEYGEFVIAAINAKGAKPCS